jgi:hypothetical protein
VKAGTIGWVLANAKTGEVGSSMKMSGLPTYRELAVRTAGTCDPAGFRLRHAGISDFRGPSERNGQRLQRQTTSAAKCVQRERGTQNALIQEKLASNDKANNS